MCDVTSCGCALIGCMCAVHSATWAAQLGFFITWRDKGDLSELGPPIVFIPSSGWGATEISTDVYVYQNTSLQGRLSFFVADN